ncbi:hypothetical protein O0I10_002993 [Lichtheimia ornata]|uniref:Uncharacterized protein n=1 Tax=Lichtheimia ornata TaxID=688661 RepID=A0AAD7V8Z1_9FUNG|nr:uncharacterized protein O0I10_002993 [Lichtheimia ornata]KAJ8661244.1 hypothetical protein O0I10_002993 [Lichtheimia ornata]
MGTDILQSIGYRNRSVDLAKMEVNLSDDGVLSLSNVFVITAEQHHSCLYRFLPSYHAMVIKMYTSKEDCISLPRLLSRDWCSSLDELICANSDIPKRQLRQLVREFAACADTDADDKDEDGGTYLQSMAALLSQLLQTFLLPPSETEKKLKRISLLVSCRGDRWRGGAPANL